MKRKAFSRVERKGMIKLAFAIDIQNGKPNRLTSYQIARKLDLTPSQHLRKILNEMVESGDLLTVGKVERSGRMDTVFYSLKHYTEPKKSRRSIALNVRGQSVGQLELWS